MIALFFFLLLIPSSSWAWTVTERCELEQETARGSVGVAPLPGGILLYLPQGLLADGTSVKVSFGSRTWRALLVGGATELKGGAKPFLEKNWATVHANGEHVIGFNLAGSSDAWEQVQDCEPAANPGGWVSLVGDITAATDDEIIRTIRRQRPEGLALDSEGGLVEEAQRIGYAVRSAKLATKVVADGQCLAECTFIFAAGKARTVEENGRVGIPAYLITKGLGVFQGDQETVADSAAYFTAMGLDGGKLATLAISANRDDMAILSPEQLRSVGLVDTATPIFATSAVGRLRGNAQIDWWLMGALLGVVGALVWGLTKIRRRI